MSRSKAKGTFAEVAVVDFLNMWATALNEENDPDIGVVSQNGYSLQTTHSDAVSERYPNWMSEEEFLTHPDVDTPILELLYEESIKEFQASDINWHARGLPFSRVTVGGILDRGDVSGPFTMIEVKNYENPVVGSLLANAEWKSDNALKPVWCLCWKAKGRGLQRVFDWHTCMTFKALTEITSIPYDEDTEPWELDGMEFEFTSPDIDIQKPKHRWKGILRVPGNRNGLDPVREQIWREEMKPANDGAIIPFVVSPRRGQGGAEMHHERWFAYTKLAGFARMLETFGILPQDERDYLTSS